MDWSKGYSSRFIVCLVDKNTWADTEAHEFISAKIDIDSESDLIASATLTMSEILTNGENYIRIYLIARQNGESVKEALFTGLTATPERKINGVRNEYSIDAYSVLKPANDIIVKRGYYVPRASGAEKVKEILSVCNAPIEVIGTSPGTSSDIVADDGATRLEVALKILSAINWRIKISGDGTITLCEKSDNELNVFGATFNDVLETSVTERNDWYECPNCYMAVSEDYGTSIAIDDSVTSKYSTVNRGREVWEYDDDVELGSNENIAEYATRRLKELQTPSRSLSYSRRYMSDLQPTDVIRLNYPRQNLDGLYRIVSQSIECEYGCTVSEEVTSIE